MSFPHFFILIPHFTFLIPHLAQRALERISECQQQLVAVVVNLHAFNDIIVSSYVIVAVAHEGIEGTLRRAVLIGQ